MTPRRNSLFALCVVVFTAFGCVTRPPEPRASVAVEATRAVYEGWDALQARPQRPLAASAAFERALLLAPDWVTPRRLLDEIARENLLGVEALAAHRRALAENASNAAALYLAGRLEGALGRRRFSDAVRYDPELAWGHHGLSYAAATEGRAREAVEHARRALELARDPWERTFFHLNLARQLAADKRVDEALALLERHAGARSTSPRDAVLASVMSVELGLDALERGTRARAYERGLELLRTRDLSDADLEGLVPRLRRNLYIEDADGVRLTLAIASRPGAVRDALRADARQYASATPLSQALIERAAERSGRADPEGARARLRRFSTFEFAAAVESWRASLPAVVVDEAGLPRAENLQRVVRAARALDAGPVDEARARLVDFGSALIAAGWFREARHVAARLGALDLDAALALDDRALAGQSVLTGIGRVLGRADRAARNKGGSSDDDNEATAPVRTLAELLDAVAPFFAWAAPFLGGESDVERVAAAIRASPRMTYAGVAELVHPGPRFSADDERDELGLKGERVAGLAQLFEKLGRFAVVGQVSGGGGPDASVLPVLFVEDRRGEHLGVAWQGTIAWCESADLKGRAGRQGAMISAAAVHEGYWVDIDAVRSELAGWSALRRRFTRESDEAVAGIDAILASSGLALDARATEEERRSTQALLGEASRVRLALLRERAQGDEVLGALSLDELLNVTAVHEQGHLCERTRFLPIWDHKLAILAFLAQCNFSPQRVGEELEYRAQLIALCDTPDPRIALAQVLDAAESGATNLTPHGAGYRRLLADLLRHLDQAVAEAPAEFPTIDGRRTLVHQLHRLPPEAVRSLARELARAKGLSR
ncbi:MAG: hypothetical protein JNL28_01870 [Planctomycetes bacterium]|nr:hypothetical protein [Planctomycetota bacterium]